MRTKNFKLLKLLVEKGVTQTDLVKRAALSSEARLSRLIWYRCNPTPDELVRIAEVIGVEVQALGFEEVSHGSN